MRRRTIGLAALGMALLGGCRSARESEREDAARLATFLAENRMVYDVAVRLEQRIIEDVGAEATKMAEGSASMASERLRQRVLSPKHTYKSLHDQLNAWQLSGRAEALRRRAVTHLKSRELGLLKFTTLLTAIRDAPGGGAPGDIEQLGVAAKEHRAAGRELEEITREARAIADSGR